MISTKRDRGHGQFGVPWSRAEIKALEPFVKGRLKGKYRNSRHAARSYLADMEENGTPSRRTPRAVWIRICRIIPGAAWENTAGWSREERRVVDRHVRVLARTTRYASNQEINACVADLRRLHGRHRGAVWAQVNRTRKSVGAMLQIRARILRRRWAGSKWTEEENRIAEPYAQALAQGRCELRDASRRCLDKLERLRRRDPGVAARRTLDIVTAHIRLRARALGRSYRWALWELRILDPCVRDFSRGKYRTAPQAAAAFQARLERRRQSNAKDLRFARRRSESAIITAVYSRAHALGLPVRAEHPIGEEKKRIEWYAGQVAKGRIRTVGQAAQEFLQEYKDLPRGRSTWSWAGSGRSQTNVRFAIWRRARQLGLPPTKSHWGPEENAVCDRYVRRLAAGEFADIPHAALPCRIEIENLHRRHPNAGWSPNERTLGAVEKRMQERMESLGVHWANTSYSSEENRVLDRYARRLVEGRIPEVRLAVEQCVRDLELRHGRFLARHPELPRSPQPRTAKSILTALSERSIRMGRSQRTPHWTGPEVEMASTWVAHCTGDPGSDQLSLVAAARGLAAELERNGYRRSPEACRLTVAALRIGWRPGRPRPASLRLA